MKNLNRYWRIYYEGYIDSLAPYFSMIFTSLIMLQLFAGVARIFVSFSRLLLWLPSIGVGLLIITVVIIGSTRSIKLALKEKKYLEKL